MTYTKVYTEYNDLEYAINQAEINPSKIKKIVVYYDDTE